MNINSTFPEVSGYKLRELTFYELVFWYVIYAFICLLAVLGNSLVILIILTRRYMRNTTNYFILNLAFADALSGLISIPVRIIAALSQVWVLPDSLCPVAPLFESLTLTVSVLTLCATAVDRFRMVVQRSIKQLRTRMVIGVIAFIWLFSLLSCTPYGVYHQTVYVNLTGGFRPIENPKHQDIPALKKICYPLYVMETPYWKAYNIYLTIATYFIPVLLIDATYAIVVQRMVSRTHMSGKTILMLLPPCKQDDIIRQDVVNRSRRRATKLLVLVAAGFTLCWLPYEFYLVWSELDGSINTFSDIQSVYLCCHCLAMSSSFINPIIYGLYHDKFRREYIRMVQCVRSQSPIHEILPSPARRNTTTRKAAIKHKAPEPTYFYVATELGLD